MNHLETFAARAGLPTPSRQNRARYMYRVAYHLLGDTLPLVAWIEAENQFQVQANIERDYPDAIIDRITQE